MVTGLLDGRAATTRIGLALGGVLAVVAGYAAVWHVLRPGVYLLVILGTYVVLLALLLVQVVRAVYMDAWRRRIAVVATTPAAAGLVLVGLRPRPGCLDLPGCGEGLTLQPAWFAAFALLTAALIAADAAWAVED